MSDTLIQPGPETFKVPPTTREAKIRFLILAKERQRRAELKRETDVLEGDLALFFREAWKILEPGRKLHWSWHYDLVAEYLWLVREKKFAEAFPDHAGIVVNCPPRTAKSSFMSVAFPVWCWLTDPTWRFMCASYSADLSLEHSGKRRDLILSPWFQERWGEKVKLKFGRNEKGQFDNEATGSMIATSVGGTAIGKGGDTLILDDPINAEQALSDVERQHANDWIDNTVRSRLNDPGAGLILMIMQRLHDMDPTGFVVSAEPGRWIHVKLPLEAEEAERWVFPVTGRVVERKAGDVLMPERFTEAAVNRYKGRRLVWAGQYQQRPTPLEGNMVKRGDVRYYGGVDPLTGEKDPPLPATFDTIFVSADCAFKDLKTSDYVAVGTIGVKGPNRYVLDVVNKHLDAGATEEEIRRQRKAMPGGGSSKGVVAAVLIEEAANGTAIIKRMRREVPGVIAINPEGNKVARMFASSPEWQAGNWHVDRNAAWTEPFLEQLLKFPYAAHDDMVDMMTQAAVWLQKRRIDVFSLELMGAGDGEGGGDGGLTQKSGWTGGSGSRAPKWGGA